MWFSFGGHGRWFEILFDSLWWWNSLFIWAMLPLCSGFKWKHLWQLSSRITGRNTEGSLKMAIPTNFLSVDTAAAIKQKQIWNKDWKAVSLYMGKIKREMDKNHMRLPNRVYKLKNGCSRHSRRSPGVFLLLLFFTRSSF